MSITSNAFDYDKEKGELDSQLKAGSLTQTEYNAKLGALGEVNTARSKREADARTVAAKNARSSRGGGSGGNNFVYVDFGNGGGVDINKNDKSLDSVYGALPGGAKLDKWQYPKPTAEQMKGAIETYLMSDAPEEEKERVREALRQRAERRKEAPAASGGQQKKKSSGVKYGNTDTSGKKSSGVKF